MAVIEEATRAQRLCRRWQEERQYRVTASKFGLVVKRRRNHTSLAKQLLYPKMSDCYYVGSNMSQMLLSLTEQHSLVVSLLTKQGSLSVTVVTSVLPLMV